MSQLGTAWSPRVSRHLAFISEFTTDIRHVRSEENAVADALSRAPPPIRNIAAIQHVPPFNYKSIAQEQHDDPELQQLLTGDTALTMELILAPDGESRVWCDTSCGSLRPYIPPSCRNSVFHHFHDLNHPGVARSLRLLTKRAVWTGSRLRTGSRHASPARPRKWAVIHLHPSRSSKYLLPASTQCTQTSLDHFHHPGVSATY